MVIVKVINTLYKEMFLLKATDLSFHPLGLYRRISLQEASGIGSQHQSGGGNTESKNKQSFITNQF